MFTNKKVEAYIDKIYEGVNSYGIDQNDSINTLKKSEKNKVFSTYGEILPSSVSKMIKNLFIDHNDVFYDLGSGSGKVVIQFYLQTPVKKAIGVEISSKRYYQSEQMMKVVKNEFKLKNKKLGFMHENIVSKKLSYKDGTIFYLCSTCFDDKLMKSIFNKITKEAKNLKAIVSLRPFPDTCDVSRFTKKKNIKLPCTWAKDTDAVIYYAY